MRRRHFEALQPVCPRCRHARGLHVPVRLATVVAEDPDGDIREGMLHCSDPACWLEFPILDGAPLLVPDPRAYIAANLAHLTARHDLSPLLESVLGDGAGPGSAFDTTRQHLGIYGWDGYADLDPEEPPPPPGGPVPGAVLRCLERGLLLADPSPQGPVLDIGCATGRSSFALAARGDDLVLGIDLNFSLLGLGREVLRSGQVRYPRRRIGLVYDRRSFPVRFAGTERVDFWVCDALALPFPAERFGFALALNVFDCVASPRDLLAALAEVLRPGGRAVLATPYDWSTAATPVQAWIGGHSQRGRDAGAGEPFLRALLTPGGHPQGVDTLRIVAEAEHCPWQARLHDRSTVAYLVHLLALQAGVEPGP